MALQPGAGIGHAAGAGSPSPVPIVRLMMALKLEIPPKIEAVLVSPRLGRKDTIGDRWNDPARV